MQAISRRLGHQSLKPSAAAISSFKSCPYPYSDHYYDVDSPRYSSTLPTKGLGQHVVRKGTGGRSSVSGIIATVFGATGFLGRYLVQQLAKTGSQVLVPFRGSEDSHRHLKLMGDLGQIVPMKYNPRDENSIKAVMAKANVVINLIGREYETRNYSFEEVNHHMAKQLAAIAKEHGGITRFINVSCLGASPSSPSRMLRAKAAAEESILHELPEATIMRPATMVGTEDRILNTWAHFVKNYGFLPLIGDGSTKIQPVYVVDVASAIVAALKDDGSSTGKVYELGGPEIFTMHELAELMFDVIREWPRYVKIPFPIAKGIAMPREILLNKVPVPMPTPSIFNLDAIEALTTDTLVSKDALTFEDLGIAPHRLRGYPIEYLIQYRKGGPQYGSTVSEKITPGRNTASANLFHCQREGTGSNLYKDLMFPQGAHEWFENVKLEGRNAGAVLNMRSGSSHEFQDSCSINIYISNNVQGVNNSVLAGSDVKLGDSGVHLSLEGLKLDKGFVKKCKRKESDFFQGMCWMLLFVVIIISLLFKLI